MLHSILNYIFKNKELGELYSSVAIRSFASSLIVIFIPLYLITVGYQLREVFLFFAFLDAAHVLCVIPSAKLAARFGFKHLMLASAPFEILFLLLLYSLPSMHWPLILIAAVGGMWKALYFVSYHIQFTRSSSTEHRGREIGGNQIIGALFATVAPLAGASLVLLFGFQAVFIMVVVLLMLSAAPLFFSDDAHEPFTFSLRSLFRQRFRDYAGPVAYGIEGSMWRAVWPLMIFFLAFENLSVVGFAASLSILFSVAFTWVIGVSTDLKRRLTLRVAALVNCALWLVRLLVRTPLQVYGTELVYGMSRIGIYIPFMALTYDKAAASDKVRYVVFREIILNASAALFFLFMAWTLNLNAGLIAAAGASLLYLFF